MKTFMDDHPPSGVRMTRQRRIILDELQAPNQHPTADAVYERVRCRMPNISLGTVYRNLELLTQAGFIRTLRLGGRQRRYDGGMHRHYHVRCMVCGKISDVAADRFDDLDAKASEICEFEIAGHELEFAGVCPSCRRARTRNAGKA